MIQHYLQDRYQLHLKWMRVIHSSPIDKWPMGPLIHDQAMHLAWIGFVYLLPRLF